MGDLAPIAFDLETTGLGFQATITVAGFSHELGNWLCLNTAGREAATDELTAQLESCTDRPVRLDVAESELVLLEHLTTFVADHIDGDTHYLTAYNGETWNGGFDLPFLRSACHQNDVAWPFDDLAYADTMAAIQRFETGDTTDLVGVYDLLIGGDTCDPFSESEHAVEAFEAADWLPLLQHNLADIERTRELAQLAGRFVPSSDFSMKNLSPPEG